MITCPVHKNGQEHKPSCGLSIIDKYRGDKLIPGGTVHCFTCNYTATLTEFISNCFGYQDAGLFGNKWIKAQYNVALTAKTRHVDLNLSRGTITREEIQNDNTFIFPGTHSTNYCTHRNVEDCQTSEKGDR